MRLKLYILKQSATLYRAYGAKFTAFCGLEKRREVAADLKAIYGATTAEEAELA